MNKDDLFEFLKGQKANQLLQMISSAYDAMSTKQRNYVFGKYEKKFSKRTVIGSDLLAAIKKFHSDSIEGYYYAPFDINSKNFSDIPEETDEWFDLLWDFLRKSACLSKTKQHDFSIECFGLLYDLIYKMEEGEEIVFAHELGSWMIPGDEKEVIAAYIFSLSETKSPKEFSSLALPLIQRDSYQSFTGKVYSTAIKFANEQQINQLKRDVETKLRLEL